MIFLITIRYKLYFTGRVAGVICTSTLADLLLDMRTIETTAHLQDVPMFQLQCAMEENCLTKSAYEVYTTSQLINKVREKVSCNSYYKKTFHEIDTIGMS